MFGTPRNISIPSSAFSDGKGSYSFQLPMAKDSQMVLSMSDATGFNTGGSSNVLTVQASQGGSCNATDPGKSCKSISATRSLTSISFSSEGVSFSFQLNTALQQCRQVFRKFSKHRGSECLYTDPSHSADTRRPYNR